MEYKRTRHSAEVTNGTVYIFGGITDPADLDIVEIYDPRENRFRLGPPMNQRRDSAASAVVNGRIYVCGGLANMKALKSCEFFDPTTNRWNADMADLPKPRAGATAAAVKKYFYVIGGSDPENRRDPDSLVERYHVDLNSWQDVASMKQQRLYAASATLNNEIYVCGGMTEDFTKSETCERYDPQADSWTLIASMLTARERLGDGLSLVSFNGRLLAVGSAEVDEYDTKTKKWTRTPGKLAERTSFVAVAL